jgi:hypothetical protein
MPQALLLIDVQNDDFPGGAGLRMLTLRLASLGASGRLASTAWPALWATLTSGIRSSLAGYFLRSRRFLVSI